MVDIAPFRALRYPPEVDLADVTAPPYDAIDEDLARRLRARHPHNVVRLELSSSEIGDPDGTGRYDRAAETYRTWRDRDALRLDDTRSVTVYEQRLRPEEGPRGQRGVLCAVRLEPWESRRILPHERVFPGPVADRLRLLEAVPANLSPIYLLAEREPDAVGDLLDSITGGPPDAAFDDGRMVHRTWRVDDPDAVEQLRDGYTDETLLVADGHHRYTTALEYLRTTGRDVPGAARILAYVVGDQPRPDLGPTVRPMHRSLSDVVDDPVAALRRAGASVRAIDAEDRDGLLAALADPQLLCVLVTSAGACAIAQPDADSPLRRGLDAAVREVDIALVDEVVADAVLARGATVRPEPDADEALRSVRGGASGGTLLVRAVEVGTVWRVAASGARMPPKSTSFFPKPRTGLVLRPLDAT